MAGRKSEAGNSKASSVGESARAAGRMSGRCPVGTEWLFPVSDCIKYTCSENFRRGGKTGQNRTFPDIGGQSGAGASGREGKTGRFTPGRSLHHGLSGGGIHLSEWSRKGPTTGRMSGTSAIHLPSMPRMPFVPKLVPKQEITVPTDARNTSRSRSRAAARRKSLETVRNKMWCRYGNNLLLCR